MPMNEAKVLRNQTAIANTIAETKIALGMANTRMLQKWAGQFGAQKRLASFHGISGESSTPIETPSIGIMAIKAAPQNRPSKNAVFLMGLVKIS